MKPGLMFKSEELKDRIFNGFFQGNLDQVSDPSKKSFNVKILDFNYDNGSFIAKGEDEFGWSGLTGLVMAFTETKEELAEEALICFDKIYQNIPLGFPEQFFGGLNTCPYDLPHSGGQFRTISYFGTIKRSDSGLLVCEGDYRLQNAGNHIGKWRLESPPK